MPAPIATLPIGNLPVGTLTIAQAAASLAQEPSVYSPGTYTFKPPRSGYWKFIGWGPGGGTSNLSDTGASGAYGEITKFLTTAQSVAIVVSPNSSATTFTFPDGTVASAGNGAQGPSGAGIATGFDVNLNGTPGVTNSSGSSPPAANGTGGGTSGGANGGAGAPANLPYRGASGTAPGSTSTVMGQSPGGGAGQTSLTLAAGGSGLALVVFLRS